MENDFTYTENDMTDGLTSDPIQQAKDKVSQAAQRIGETIDSQRHKAAAGLDKTASALHQGGDKLGSAVHGAAHSIESTASYLRKNDMRRMMDDVGNVVKNNPGPSLVAAVVLGFILGHALNRE
jgi:hypothetical protein